MSLEPAGCAFCEQPAVTTKIILTKEDGTQEKPVCQEHADFYGWIYSILGKLARERTAVRNLPEGKDYHGKFR